MELETKSIDARFYLESTKKIEDEDTRMRLMNCFLFNRHFELVKEKRTSSW